MLIGEYQNEELLNNLQGLLNVDIQIDLKDINLNKGIVTLIFDENKKQLNIEIKTKFPFIQETAKHIVNTFFESFKFAKFINVFVHCDYENPFKRNGFVCDYEQHRINEEVIPLDNELKTLFNHRLEKTIKEHNNQHYQKYNQKQANINKNILRKDKLKIVSDITNLSDDDIEILISSLK